MFVVSFYLLFVFLFAADLFPRLCVINKFLIFPACSAGCFQTVEKASFVGGVRGSGLNRPVGQEK